MASLFPEWLSNTGSNESFTTSHTADAPATTANGDLLLLTVAYPSSSITVSAAPSGWTSFINESYNAGLSGQGTLRMWAIRADGTEGGGAIAFTTSSSTESASIITRINAGTWDDTGTLSNAIETGTAVTGPTLNAGSIATSWGSDKTLFGVPSIVFTTSAVSSYPTGYVNTAQQSSGFSSSALVCFQEIETASEDAGAYSFGGSNPNGIVVPIAILGGGGGGGGLFFGPGF